ncbi:ABC transporter ATP-binding protein [Alkaliphilus peptidifermentans]|uniref:ABC-type quaternary amine transporter n=1 Tax=Alkaliphilus peptidifermentans DSM 18978 TaxID=1120976 RepID=A0A1G5CDD6_9FIRM|nr:ABC transporter ATP-binding protein [Alkaliphilus peptidifermentans]SCY00433.1 putative spermidine/putrescine transport system ATP-binding protein [Alkaliphilus peptidifermentans DSM 18978]
MPLLSLKNIDVSYDGKTNILEKLNLSINKGELVSLLGPSGCGKTTTLRVIAGFIEPVGGQFILEDQNFTKIPVHKRNFGIVFQSYALFPHLTVFDNVAFGLKMKKISKDKIKDLVDSILNTVDLSSLSQRYPKELSGGQRQRVAIARALVIEPKLLLLDEPLSNLDAKLRLKMRVEIKKLQRQMGITTVFVTHDQEECFSISDKVAVMNAGEIEQFDTPENIYSNPSTEFVARFVGFENFIDLSNISGNEFHAKGGKKFTINSNRDITKENIKGTIRPDDIEIVDENSNKENLIDGSIDVRTYLGKSYQYNIKTDLGTLVVNGSNNNVYSQGDNIKLYLPSSKIILV